MGNAVAVEVALQYLRRLEAQGADAVYCNNAPLPLAEVRRRLQGATRVYLHRGLIYVP